MIIPHVSDCQSPDGLNLGPFQWPTCKLDCVGYSGRHSLKSRFHHNPVANDVQKRSTVKTPFGEGPDTPITLDTVAPWCLSNTTQEQEVRTKFPTEHNVDRCGEALKHVTISTPTMTSPHRWTLRIENTESVGRAWSPDYSFQCQNATSVMLCLFWRLSTRTSLFLSGSIFDIIPGTLLIPWVSLRWFHIQ